MRISTELPVSVEEKGRRGDLSYHTQSRFPRSLIDLQDSMVEIVLFALIQRTALFL